ncbi:response regulator transcription factor [uncultured Adlercreutzia sp.]|uniref:response regulator transcription factor n=2 Tax=uncultured Adlercreutzia sp. TaxID=875803 RepID=UPI0026F37E97|nr:helix-turn-helix transcriptional regulator [uncultured Adlercreutzia sp.]
MRGILARISEYQGGDSVSLSMFLNMRVWGFAFQRAWVYVMFVGMGANSVGLSPSPLPPAVYQWSSLALCTTLLLAAVAYRRMEQALYDRRVRWFATILTSACTLGAFVLTAIDAPVWLLALVGGVGTGAGSGLLDLGYGEIYRNRPPSEVGIEIPTAALFAGILYAVISNIPSVAAVAIVSLLPLASGLIMTLQQHTWATAHVVKASTSLEGAVGFLLRIGLCTCVISLADGIMRQTFMTVASVSPHQFYHPGMLVSSIVMAVLLIGFLLLRREGTFRDLYKLITFIIAASIVLTPVFVESAAWDSLLVLVGYNTFNVFVWILLANIAYSLRLPATFVFGFGWGLLTVGNTMGHIIGSAMISAVELSSLTLSLITALTTLAIFAMLVFVLKDDDLVDLKKMQFTVEASEESESEATPAGESTGDGDADGIRPGSFRDRCMTLASEAGLTPRETEILLLFARGRSSTYIQEELFISRGTVTTHLQHIYRKTGVHSKQELLDLVESKRDGAA